VLGVVAIGLIASGVLWWLRDGEQIGSAVAAEKSGRDAATVDPASSSPHVEEAQATLAEEGSSAIAARLSNDEDLAPSEPLVIRGRVVSEENGEPVPGAEIGVDHHPRIDGRFESLADMASTWNAADPKIRDPETAITDADGRYELHLARAMPEEFKVAARAHGFGRREQSVFEFLGNELTVDFALLKARRASGRVIDSEGRPVKGAIVSAHASTYGTEGVMSDFAARNSGADGVFLLEDLRPDLTHVLQVRKPGFGQLVYAFLADEKAFDEVPFGDLVLARETRLEVTVADDTGESLVGVSLYLTGGNGDWLRFAIREPTYDRLDLWRRRGTTDANGCSTFAELGVGTWRVSASLRGRPYRDPIDVTIDGREPVKQVRFEFPRGKSIEGRVVDETGRPFADANVFVQQDGTESFLWLVTDQAGRFAARGLEKGRFRVWTVGSARDESVNPDQPQENQVVVQAGTRDVELRTTRPRVETIRGIVRDTEGLPVAFAWVKAILPNQEAVITRTRVGGRFGFTVPPGVRVSLIAGPEDVWPPRVGDSLDLSGLPTASGADHEIELTYRASR
jgi:protocatechuate 3,4-dioxygenase beta subunit